MEATRTSRHFPAPDRPGDGLGRRIKKVISETGDWDATYS